MIVIVGLMFVFAGNQLDRRLDERVGEVQKEFDASLNKFREDVRKELDARGAGGGAVDGGHRHAVPDRDGVPDARRSTRA